MRLKEYFNVIRDSTLPALLPLLDEIGELVARASRISEPYLSAFVREIISTRTPRHILEVGCGSGAYLRCAAEAHPDVGGIGIEIDHSVVEQARANLKTWGLNDRFKIILGDIRQPPEELGSPFDLVTMYNNNYYFSEAERPALFDSLRAILAPGGAIAIVSSFQSDGKDLSAANLNLATSAMAGCTPLPEIKTLSNQLKENGFDTVAVTRLWPGSSIYALVAT